MYPSNLHPAVIEKCGDKLYVPFIFTSLIHPPALSTSPQSLYAPFIISSSCSVFDCTVYTFHFRASYTFQSVTICHGLLYAPFIFHTSYTSVRNFAPLYVPFSFLSSLATRCMYLSFSHLLHRWRKMACSAGCCMHLSFSILLHPRVGWPCKEGCMHLSFSHLLHLQQSQDSDDV